MSALIQLAALSSKSPSTDDFWTVFWSNMTAAGWRLAHVAAIVVGALLAAWILRLIIRRVVRQIVSSVKKTQRVDETQALAASPLAAVRLVQRTRTLGTVLSNIVNVVIGVIALVAVIDVLVPNFIGSLALLTAAVGAGLGFGAQNIVKDVFNGLFMVMEDQLGVGDVVDVQLATGVVEAVGIRVTQVRDVNGVLWFVRNGEILRVGNVSQGWSRVIIDLAAPYETDVEEIQRRMLETADALASDSKWRSRILEKPEIWGLQSVSDDALVIRIVIKSRSMFRDDVARELRLRLKKTTDEMGITLPSLASVVLDGFDDIASIGGSHIPRTNPLPIAQPAKTRRGRKRAGAPAADHSTGSANPAGDAAANAPKSGTGTSLPKHDQTTASTRSGSEPTAPTRTPSRKVRDPHAIPIVDPGRAIDDEPNQPLQPDTPPEGGTGASGTTQDPDQNA